jgi:hypothetical protein
MDIVDSQVPPGFVPRPSYRKAPPPFRERAEHVAARAAGWIGVDPRARRPRVGGLGGLGEATPTDGVTPVEVINDPRIAEASPPSTYAVAAFLEGSPGSGVRLLGLTALRAVFILPGLWIASAMSPVKLSGGQLVAFSLASSATITGGMLGWYKLHELRSGR